MVSEVMEYQPPDPNRPKSSSPLGDLSQAQDAIAMPHPVSVGYSPGGGGSVTSKLAIWSMVCGILSLLCFVVTAIPAIVLGHVALVKIKRSQTGLVGKPMAIAGLVIGYLMTIVSIVLLVVLPPIIKLEMAKQRALMASILVETIYDDIEDYSEMNDGKAPYTGDKSDFANAHLRLLFDQDSTAMEYFYFVQGVGGAVRPDEITNGPKALEQGENCYGYVAGLDFQQAPGELPLLIVPMRESNGIAELDKNAFGGLAVVMTVDGVATKYKIQSDGSIIDRASGKVIFKEGKAFDSAGKGYLVCPPDLY